VSGPVLTGPREGAYLDATLAQIEARVDADIERMTRRRHRRRIALVATLVLSTVAFGTAAAAVAVTGVWQVDNGATHQFECLQGDSIGNDSYFAVSFRVVDADSGYVVDPVRICTAAWTGIAVQTGSVDAFRHRDADSMFATGLDALTTEAELQGLDTVPTFDISSVAFGSVDFHAYGGVIPEMAVCERTVDGSVWVISAEPGESGVSRAEWTKKCSVNHGFAFAPGLN
jgi:hypothetical protein